MSSTRRFFTHESATQLLPQVIAWLQSALESRQALKKSEGDLAAYKKRLVMSGGAYPNTNRIAAYADQAKTLHADMKASIDNIQNLGIEVRDVDRGLIDFPASHQGRTVYLCFQLGETAIEHWHPEDEGFAGRRPITPEFIEQLDAGLSN